MEGYKDVVYFKVKNEDGKLKITKQYCLHSEDCNNTEEDTAIMQCKLLEDPECLERKCYDIEKNRKYFKVGALLSAIYQGHDNCAKFLISIGANVEEKCGNDNIIDICIRQQRLQILEYLFKNKIMSPIYNVNEINMDPPAYYFGINHYMTKSIREIPNNDDYLNLFLKYGVPTDDVKLYDIGIGFENTPAATTLYYDNKCGALKTLLLHGAILDHRQTGRHDLSGEIKEGISLIHYLVTAFTYLGPQKSPIKFLHKLNILYELGANLWETNSYGELPIDLLHGERVDRNMIPNLKELMEKPLSLQSLCRISLLRAHGPDYLSVVRSLENTLPEEILQFLRGEDLIEG